MGKGRTRAEATAAVRRARGRMIGSGLAVDYSRDLTGVTVLSVGPPLACSERSGADARFHARAVQPHRRLARPAAPAVFTESGLNTHRHSLRVLSKLLGRADCCGRCGRLERLASDAQAYAAQVATEVSRSDGSLAIAESPADPTRAIPVIAAVIAHRVRGLV